jgi:hypothetical protein
MSRSLRRSNDRNPRKRDRGKRELDQIAKAGINKEDDTYSIDEMIQEGRKARTLGPNTAEAIKRERDPRKQLQMLRGKTKDVKDKNDPVQKVSVEFTDQAKNWLKVATMNKMVPYSGSVLSAYNAAQDALSRAGGKPPAQNRAETPRGAPSAWETVKDTLLPGR